MAQATTGRCLNIGNCSIANSMKVVSIEDGSEFTCPECGKSLQESAGRQGKQNPLVKPAVIGFALIAAVSGSVFVQRYLSGSKTQDFNPDGAPSPVVGNSSAKPILRLVGSNTIGAKLGPELVQGFFQEKGCTQVDLKEPQHDEFQVSCTLNGQQLLASVQSKGSSTAFTALKSGEADVGMSSRRIKPKEVSELSSFGDLSGPGNEHVIALDGLAIVVHPSNQITQLSIEQVRDIFTGSIAGFTKVGGTGGAIKLFRRDDKSGTFDSFKTMVMDSGAILSSAKQYEDSRQLSQDVSNAPEGIGFVGFTYVGASRAVPIGAAGQQGLLPTRFTISTEDYPLSRRLYLYTISSSGNSNANEFIRFVLSSKGQKIVEANKFVPMDIVKQRTVIPKSTSSEYRKLTGNAERLSVNFRFKSGSDQLDNRALADLDRVTEFLIKNSIPPSRLVMIGFADSTGNPMANVNLSKQRAQAVASALKSRGIAPGVITGFGADNPVASNAKPEGQEKNRRVEVWVSR